MWFELETGTIVWGLDESLRYGLNEMQQLIAGSHFTCQMYYAIASAPSAATKMYARTDATGNNPFPNANATT